MRVWVGVCVGVFGCVDVWVGGCVGVIDTRLTSNKNTNKTQTAESETSRNVRASRDATRLHILHLNVPCYFAYFLIVFVN